MIEIGQWRFMRDGSLVKVLEIVDLYDPYFKRAMPYVRLQHPKGIITRRVPTVESYLLAEFAHRVSGTDIWDPM